MHARDLRGDAPVLVLNSENLWIDGPTDAIRELAAGWDDARMDALLLLVPLARANNHRGKGDFRLAADGRITGRRGRNRVAPFVFPASRFCSRDCWSMRPRGRFLPIFSGTARTIVV